MILMTNRFGHLHGWAGRDGETVQDVGGTRDNRLLNGRESDFYWQNSQDIAPVIGDLPRDVRCELEGGWAVQWPMSELEGLLEEDGI